MNILPASELRTLLGKHPGACVSIYMPTHSKGTETQEDPAELKKMIREAEERLAQVDLRSSERIKLLAPVQSLLDDALFWKQRSNGLAIFVSPDMFRYYRLPLDFSELVVVSDRFHIKPLLPMLCCDGKFYVLALSQNDVRLLQCTHYGVKQVDLPSSVPRSLAEALRYDETERILQFHSGAPTGGKQGLVFHGHGVGDVAKKNMLRYFQQIDRGLRDILREETAPLIVACVRYLFPIYEEANTYQYLLDKGITGNPERLSWDKLREQAWAVVQPFFEQGRVQAVSQYKEFRGTGRTSKNTKEGILNSYIGRVEVLFIAAGVQQWGTFDPNTNVVNLHQTAKPGDEDLLDFAAAHTLINKGVVYAMGAEEMPDNSPLVCILRY